MGKTGTSLARSVSYPTLPWRCVPQKGERLQTAVRLSSKGAENRYYSSTAAVLRRGSAGLGLATQSRNGARGAALSANHAAAASRQPSKVISNGIQSAQGSLASIGQRCRVAAKFKVPRYSHVARVHSPSRRGNAGDWKTRRSVTIDKRAGNDRGPGQGQRRCGRWW